MAAASSGLDAGDFFTAAVGLAGTVLAAVLVQVADSKKRRTRVREELEIARLLRETHDQDLQENDEELPERLISSARADLEYYLKHEKSWKGRAQQDVGGLLVWIVGLGVLAVWLRGVDHGVRTWILLGVGVYVASVVGHFLLAWLFHLWRRASKRRNDATTKRGGSSG